MELPSIGGGISSMITGISGAKNKVQGGLDNSRFMGQMQDVQATMQQNQVDKAKLDAENQRINGIADSAAQAGSAAAQVKIQY